MGVSAFLTKYYEKRVLYLNASRLQNFQYMLDNDTPVTSHEIYTKLLNPSGQIYEEIKHVLRKESFSYLPAFKAALMSVGLQYEVYGKIALSAKKSRDFDFIVIDAECTFDEDIAAYSGRQGYAVENDLFPVNALYNVGLADRKSVV